MTDLPSPTICRFHGESWSGRCEHCRACVAERLRARVGVDLDPGTTKPVVIRRGGHVVHRLSVEDCLGHIHDLSKALLDLNVGMPVADDSAASGEEHPQD